jgi:hypothetical protein
LIHKSPHPDPDLKRGIFVARAFTEQGKNIESETIFPIANELGLRLVTCANARSANVVETIKTAINSCIGLIAVPLERNPNVFFEIGYAIAMGKPCVLISESDTDLGMLLGHCPTILLSPSPSAHRELELILRDWSK